MSSSSNILTQSAVLVEVIELKMCRLPADPPVRVSVWDNRLMSPGNRHAWLAVPTKAADHEHPGRLNRLASRLPASCPPTPTPTPTSTSHLCPHKLPYLTQHGHPSLISVSYALALSCTTYRINLKLVLRLYWHFLIKLKLSLKLKGFLVTKIKLPLALE